MVKRIRNAKWKTRALQKKSKEWLVQQFSVEVVEGRDLGVFGCSQENRLDIGTAVSNQIVLSDASVSRHHCSIIATDKGFLLRDHESTNGSFLGGCRIQSGYLEDRDLIDIGESRLQFSLSEDSVSQLLSSAEEFGELRGGSPSMRRVYALAEKVAPVNASLLLEGDTGTGKTLMARSVHRSSPRKSGPFVVVDCGAIPESLVESELFGHERGAFTGAVAQHIGAFEGAQGGTLFLDEVGELGLDVQAKLLRVLEQKEVRRIGGSEIIPLDVRIISATNRNLREGVNRGEFRADLFFRLNVMSIRMPSLRERKEDIPMLMESFWDELGNGAPRPSADLIRHFMKREWPGNVRELRAAVQRCLVLGENSREEEVTTSGLNFALSYREAKEEAIAEWEARYLPELIARHDGNLSRAARAVRMDRNYLRKLLKNRGLLTAPPGSLK